jgi:hypothetical protein
MSKVNQFWKESSLPVKVGVGVIGVYILSKAISSLKSSLGGEFGKNYNKDLNKLETKNILPSYSDQVYVGFADTIYSEYANEFFSDVEDVIPIINKMTNDADMLKLTQAFGDRRFMFSGTKGNLGAIIRKMFDNSEIETLNEILSRKGINYRF